MSIGTSKPCNSVDEAVDYSSLLQSRVHGLQQVKTLHKETKDGSLAICVSGGLRGAQMGAASLVSAMVQPNLDRLRKVGVFVATWADRQCSNRTRGENTGFLKVTKGQVQQIYGKAGVNVEDIWIGNSVGQGIPGRFNKSWGSHSSSEYPLGGMHMLDGTHRMATLWQQCLDLVPTDYEVIAHVRPDQHFPPNYRWHFQKESDGIWEVNIEHKDSSWKSILQNQRVYMSLNKYHMDQKLLHVLPKRIDVGDKSDVAAGTIPDDRLGFGLAEPMRAVFATMNVYADQGDYDISQQKYRTRWGAPLQDFSGPITLLNPWHTWVREQYPEKLLKHHILQRGLKYTLISDDTVSPYDIVTLERGC